MKALVLAFLAVIITTAAVEAKDRRCVERNANGVCKKYAA